MSLFVFGHRNPDTDAICSALAYADLLQKTRRPEAIAAACGPPNGRTEYALKTAGLAPPRMVMDVRPEIEDVCHRSPEFAYDTEIFYDVYQKMEKHSYSALPVCDKNGKFVGLLELLDLLKLIFEGNSDSILSRQVESSVNQICKVLDGTIQNGTDLDTISLDTFSELAVTVGAMSAEGFTKRLSQLPPEELLVVSGNRPTIHLPALELGVRILVITGGYELSPGLLQLAKINDTAVILSPHDTATTTMRIKSARGIQSAIKRDCVTLSPKQLVADVRKTVDRLPQELFPVVDDESRLVGVLSKSDLINPPKHQLVLVDHNEYAQSVRGAEDAEVVEVLDHHRLGGGLKSSQPIRFVMDTVGSTCTLVAREYRANGITPTSSMALCMASGIISDTLFLRSPTTTDSDKEILQWLGTFCEVELEDFAQAFFETGSALRTCSANQVVYEDCKEFEEQGVRFSISQIEEIGFELFWNRKDELLEALDEVQKQKGVDFAALLVTNIVTNGSILVLSEEPEHWEEINYPRLEKHVYQLDGVVSRKKQLLPLFVQLIENSVQNV